MKARDLPAFPQARELHAEYQHLIGATLRDIFALAAMQTLVTRWPPLALKDSDYFDFDTACKQAVKASFAIADAMLEERTKE